MVVQQETRTKAMKAHGTQTKEQAHMVSIAVQTRRPKTKARGQQTETEPEPAATEGRSGESESTAHKKREGNPTAKATAMRKRQVEMEMTGHCGSLSETDDDKLKASMQERMRIIKEALDVMPDKTSLLLLRMVKKQMEIRSKEPKIPW